MGYFWNHTRIGVPDSERRGLGERSAHSHSHSSDSTAAENHSLTHESVRLAARPRTYAYVCVCVQRGFEFSYASQLRVCHCVQLQR